jgi:poly(3-hydroxybutyrate) depolymerase
MLFRPASAVLVLVLVLAGCDSTTQVSDGGSGGAGGGDAEGGPDAFLPVANGPCPFFTQGPATVTPAGIAPRQVQIYMGAEASAGGGPLLFYWHGTGSLPAESTVGLNAAFDAILAAGGIVVAPTHDPAAGQFPWYLTDGGGESELHDMLVADEVVACAISEVGIDPTRIHSVGMSAGALQTAQMAYWRSGYIASIATYSGGLLGAGDRQDPDNKIAAMIFHGGVSDEVFDVSFQGLSELLHADFAANGQFSFLCNHGDGHAIPPEPGPASVWQFFQDHPYGTSPSPYAAALPAGFPSYCSL